VGLGSFIDFVVPSDTTLRPNLESTCAASLTVSCGLSLILYLDWQAVDIERCRRTCFTFIHTRGVSEQEPKYNARDKANQLPLYVDFVGVSSSALLSSGEADTEQLPLAPLGSLIYFSNLQLPLTSFA
jgi:hypothetical protein